MASPTVSLTFAASANSQFNAAMHELLIQLEWSEYNYKNNQWTFVERKPLDKVKLLYEIQNTECHSLVVSSKSTAKDELRDCHKINHRYVS